MQAEPSSSASGGPHLEEQLRADGFAFLPRGRSLESLGDMASNWAEFAASWDRLGLDRHMADQGRYRRRRHGVLRMRLVAGQASIERLPDAPHFQELEHNRLNGGMDRSFLPIEDETMALGPFRTLVEFGGRLFGQLLPEAEAWLVEAHQFRIEARAGESGQPTPEGIHRDGVDYVLVALVRRENIESGTTTIHRPSGEQLGRFTLESPLDLALVDDHRVWHGVTAVQPVHPERPAWRDVLVLTYRKSA